MSHVSEVAVERVRALGGRLGPAGAPSGVALSLAGVDRAAVGIGRGRRRDLEGKTMAICSLIMEKNLSRFLVHVISFNLNAADSDPGDILLYIIYLMFDNSH